MKTVKAGILGCGHVSGIYLRNLQRFKELEIVACADLDTARAVERAAEYGIARVCGVDELLKDEEIGLIINLTSSAAHKETCLAVLQAGKHVYVEKPLAVTLSDAAEVLAAAGRRGLRVGSAPDTFLGAGVATCRKLIDGGLIGRPFSAAALMLADGPESWHAAPEFFYEPEMGPMMDMGPYYMTALVHLLGPVRSVSAQGTGAVKERLITGGPRAGETFRACIPTHIAGTVEFASGAVASVTASYDAGLRTDLPNIEIYGTEGTLRVPFPVFFNGPVLYRKKGGSDWTEMPLVSDYTGNYRGLGTADMARSLLLGEPHRASGELAYHVIETVKGFGESVRTGRFYTLASSCTRPSPLPEGF